MAGVFVSYAREDVAKAKAIARELEGASFDVWFDERIHSGSEFSREIEQALAGSAAVVVLWSAHSVNSPWVRDEAAEGRDSGRLVPVLLDESRPPIGFRQFQATDLSRWSGRGRPKQFDQLVDSIRGKDSAPQPVPAAAAAARAHVRGWSARPWLIAGSVMLVLLAIGGGLLLRNRTDAQSSTVSVALTPFQADSGSPEERKLASATHDAVVHTLSQGTFAVSAIDSAAGGRVIPADFLISGELSSTPDKVVASVRIEETKHQVVVFSHRFEASRDKASSLPELVGAQLAAQISWTAPMIALERRHPSDPAVTAAVLQTAATGLVGGNPLRDYENAQRLAERAPNSPVAQNTYAFSTAFVLDALPREQREAARAAALRASERAIALAPEFGDAYVPWCLLHDVKLRAECEDHIRAGMRADPDSPFASHFLVELVLHPVGRNREAAELAGLSLAHDQYMPAKIGLALLMSELTGQTDDAEDLYRQSLAWWPQDQGIGWARRLGIAGRGDFEALQRIDAQERPRKAPDRVLVAVNGKSLPALRAACAGAQDIDAAVCMIGFAKLNDLDDAYAFANQLFPVRSADDGDATANGRFVAFLTDAAGAPLRRDARFIPLADRLGLLAYWRTGRLPDFCQPPAAEPVCAQLRRR